MRTILLIAFMVLSSAAAFAQNGTISGTVTYSRNIPLHDVTVRVSQTGRTTRTDTEGRYTLTDVAPGRYTLIYHLEGFSDVARVLTVTAGSNLTLNIELPVLALREQVTVTSTGSEQSVFDSFQNVISVGSTRVTEKASTSIGEVLEEETGVAKRSFGPGTSRPVIRGFDGDRVLILQDGVRVGSLGSQSGDHGEPVDPLSAERIEVLKGPATLLYGSNAIGGVVNVIGHHGDDYHDGFRGFVTGVAGTTNRQAGFAAGTEYGISNFLFRGNIGAQRTGDFDTPEGEIHNSFSRSNNGSFGVGYYGSKAWIQGSFAADIRRYGIPFAGEFHGHHDDDDDDDDDHLILGDEDHDELDIVLRSRNYDTRFSGGFRDLNNPFLSGIQYGFTYGTYRHKEIEIDVEHDESEVATVFDNRIFSYRTLFEQQKYQRLTGRFGFEGFNRNYEVEGEEQLIDGKVTQNSFSVFALEELDFDRIKLQFGGRIENNRYRTEDPLLLDRSFTGFSGGLGINVGLWEGGAFVANYTHSHRAPALEELYNNGPHVGNITFEIGNDDLRSERSNGIDLSLRHLARNFRLTGNIFYYRINNFVFLAPQDEDDDGEVDIEDGLPVARFEQDNASFVGGEISAEATFNRYLGGFLSFDVVRAKLVDEDIDLPRIPPAKARLGLDFRYNGLSLRPEVVFASAQTKIFPLETRTAGYGIFNIGGSYTIGRHHHAHIFSFNAYNLTNKLYRNHVNFIKDLLPEIGRGIRFGYTVRFF